MKTVGYSLWIMPPPNICSRLQKVIENLSSNLRTPLFEPHVTLFPDILGDEYDIMSKSGRIAQSLQHFDVSLASVGTSNEYFRSIFINASSAELMSANLVCKKNFNRENDPPYNPHLSLLYGNVAESEKKKILALLPNLSSTFRVESIRLNYMNGTPAEWHKVKDFSL